MMSDRSPSRIEWPDGKDFAFTIFDDTDRATIDNVGGVYELMRDLGFRTTKSVWPLKGTGTPVCGGSTLEDPDYLSWVKKLQSDGFEIGYHMATYHDSDRAVTQRGLDSFRERIGYDPPAMANHVGCQENIYWGAERFKGLTALVYNVLTRFTHANISSGHIESSPYFWGDLCSERIRYVREFIFPEMNTLSRCPMMPYHDSQKPYVRAWYASSEGSKVDKFLHTIREEQQDRLEAEGGACIMYAHLAFGFQSGREINPEFRRLMDRLSKKNGWFVPVGTLLQFLEDRNGLHQLTAGERRRLRFDWFRNKIFTGTT